eukprot:scaffold430746_cov23-Prasinocladus_malaysianus.AAC.1
MRDAGTVFLPDNLSLIVCGVSQIGGGAKPRTVHHRVMVASDLLTKFAEGIAIMSRHEGGFRMTATRRSV